jgi:hypothetical protein
MLKSQINSEEFVASLYQSLTTNLRNPLRITPESIAHKDIKNVRIYTFFKKGVFLIS